MPPPSHQTLRIKRGRHRDPEDGASVMELAAMLAGEPFSDHPRCASPVVGELLRTYNDVIDDARRQTLYRCAAEVVGSRASRAIEQARVRACEQWVDSVLDERHRSRWGRWRLRRAARRHALAGAACTAARVGATLAAQDGDVGHARTLAFVDSLLSISRATAADASTDPRHPVGVAGAC